MHVEEEDMTLGKSGKKVLNASKALEGFKLK